MIKIQCSNEKKVEFISNVVNKFPDQLIFKNFYFFDSLSSTQDYAQVLSKQPDTTIPFVVMTDIQTGGRGRRGANWASPKGGIWMSLAFESGLETAEIFTMLILPIYVISESIRSYLGIYPQIKWPNDILVDGKKVAGILVDTEIQRGTLTRVIIGMGINSNNDLEITKSQIIDKSPSAITINYDIATLKSSNHNQEISNFELVSSMLYNFSKLVPKLSSKLFRDELRQWYKRKIKESSKTLNYNFKLKDKEYTGKIVLVNDDGSILVRNSGPSLDNKLIRIESVFDFSSV